MSPGNDLSGTARRRLSQSLVYLCRAKEKTADELARETGIPASYIEEELEMLCRGVNGQYGLLRKNEQGMYEDFPQGLPAIIHPLGLYTEIRRRFPD